MHYVLIYDLASDYLARRPDFRAEHLALAWKSADRGEMVLGGVVGDPVESGLLVFSCESAEVPTAFAQADPYVRNGLVSRWKVRPWNTVVGAGAANPVRPT